MISWKRRPEKTITLPTASSVLPAETGQMIGTVVGSVIASIGCITGNIGGLATAVNERLASGDLSPEQAIALLNRLKNVHQDVETTCMVVTRARGDLAPAEAQPHDDTHPH